MNYKIFILTFLSSIVRKLRFCFLKLKGYDIKPSTIIESNVILDKIYPKKIHIGEYTLVGSGCVILCHDHCKRTKNNEPYYKDTYIGKNCFIAINSIILPGVIIEDEVIIGAGSVVTHNIPSHSVAVGNPAKVIRTGIQMNNLAALINWNEEKGWID